jgi:hypothetical protein
VKRSIAFCVFAEPVAETDVQRLPGVRAGRVVAEQLRVAVGGAPLEPAADLAGLSDEVCVVVVTDSAVVAGKDTDDHQADF